MASITTKKRKNGIKWYVIQNHYNADGERRPIWVPCTDRKEALRLLPEVEDAERQGIAYVRPDDALAAMPLAAVRIEGMTVEELLSRYVDGARQQWDANTLGNARHIIADYIVPYIGSVPVANVNPMMLQSYYNDLPNHKAVQGNRKRDPGNISARTVREVHKILRPALNKAVLWGALPNNPALPLEVPKEKKQAREQWTEAEMVDALNMCTDPQLRAAMATQFAATTRSGELLGLTWDCVDISDLKHASITIEKELMRLKIRDMHDTGERGVFLKFPPLTGRKNTTVLVLKTPKNVSSIRKVYLPVTVAELLQDLREAQNAEKAAYGDDYHDYNLVFCRANGNPLEQTYMSQRFKKFVRVHNLRMVDFYALRHAGATAKLRGTLNLKAVQGDMGHASPEMLTKVYAAIVDEDRAHNAEVIEKSVKSQVRHPEAQDTDN